MLDEDLALCMQGVVFSEIMASVICLHFRMQEEDILEHSNGKCHEVTMMVKLLINNVT
jgi:hypothetical protein